MFDAQNAQHPDIFFGMRNILGLAGFANANEALLQSVWCGRFHFKNVNTLFFE